MIPRRVQLNYVQIKTIPNSSNSIKNNAIKFCKPLSLGTRWEDLSLSVSGTLGTLGNKWLDGRC